MKVHNHINLIAFYFSETSLYVFTLLKINKISLGKGQQVYFRISKWKIHVLTMEILSKLTAKISKEGNTQDFPSQTTTAHELNLMEKWILQIYKASVFGVECKCFECYHKR